MRYGLFPAQTLTFFFCCSSVCVCVCAWMHVSSKDRAYSVRSTVWLLLCAPAHNQISTFRRACNDADCIADGSSEAMRCKQVCVWPPRREREHTRSGRRTGGLVFVIIKMIIIHARISDGVRCSVECVFFDDKRTTMRTAHLIVVTVRTQHVTINCTAWMPVACIVKLWLHTQRVVAFDWDVWWVSAWVYEYILFN